MTNVLAISLASMQQEMSRLDQISANMANASTPAYKRQVAMSAPVVDSGFATAMQAQRPSAAGTPALPATSVPAANWVQSDDSPGTLKATNQPLDVALTGHGYFEVETKQGLAYTRQGNWQLDARGRLVTARGDAVMGTGGEIVLSSLPVRIDAKGQVFAGADDANASPVGQLKVVRFDDPLRLSNVGSGLVTSPDQPVQLSDSDIEIRQGYLENSNVNSAREMVQLIHSMRHFESMQKVATAYDDMLGGAIRKLGDLS